MDFTTLKWRGYVLLGFGLKKRVSESCCFLGFSLIHAVRRSGQ